MNASLSASEAALMDLACAHPDWSREQLADAAGISPHTVKAHLDRATRKYGAQTHKAALLTHDRRSRRVRRSRQRRSLGQLEWLS
jgi:DNA-binding CsgD family transcriptional regulator